MASKHVCEAKSSSHKSNPSRLQVVVTHYVIRFCHVATGVSMILLRQCEQGGGGQFFKATYSMQLNVVHCHDYVYIRNHFMYMSTLHDATS